MKEKIGKVILPALSVTVALWGGGVALGAWLKRVFVSFDAWPLYRILIGAFAVLCLINYVAARLFRRSHFSIPPEERRRFLDERQEAARRDAAGMLSEQGSLLLRPMITLFLYSLLAMGLTVVGQMCLMPLAIPGFILLYMPVLLLFCTPRLHLDGSVLAPTEALPALHALARRAAEAAGVQDIGDGKRGCDIRIEVAASANVDVNRIGRTYVVILGTMALAVSTEEELYADLLGGFSGYADPAEARRERREERIAAMGSPTLRLGSFPFDLFYANAAARLEWDRLLAYYPRIYRRFDRMLARIREAGVEQAYLSRTVKEDMWRLFSIEYANLDPILLYETPEPPTDYETRLAVCFRQAVSARREAWCRLLEGELHSDRSAVLLTREIADGLGLGGRPLLSEAVFPSADSDYGRACTEAIALGDRRVTQDVAPNYAETRRREYAEPLEVIESQKASERPWPTPELSPVLNAYRDLFRTDEAEALCDRILREEPNQFAQAHALYLKGQILLHRYDSDGIDYIYRAMDINKNYMENGLNSVEDYCALCGLADELEAHHRRADTQREAHSYNQQGACSLSASDRLEQEEALGDRLTDILDYMEAAGEGWLERVYLVRKVVSEDFFTSAFVLYFTPGADEEAMRNAYKAIFNYLDTYPEDWQFSLFLYDRDTEAAVRRVKGSLVWERKDEK